MTTPKPPPFQEHAPDSQHTQNAESNTEASERQPLPSAHENSRGVTEALTRELDIIERNTLQPGERQAALLRLRNLLQERQKLGIARYGRSLQTFNGRDSKRDAVEEMVDLFQYQMQMGMEMEHLKAENSELAVERAKDKLTIAQLTTRVKQQEEALDEARNTNSALPVAHSGENKRNVLHALIREAYDTAVSKGWWEGDRGEQAESKMGELIALMHSELSEALEEWRVSTKQQGRAWLFRYESDGKGGSKPEGVMAEFADVLIRIFDATGGLNARGELVEALIAKMDYNKTRPHRHGNKRA